MATRRTSRVQVSRAVSRYSYGARVVPTAAPARTPTTTSSRSDPAYVAAQLRNVMESRDHQALTDLQNGKLIPFIAYAEERITHPVDDADQARWTKLLEDARSKAEENDVAAGIASGEVPLEDAQRFLEDHRSKYEPSDPRFAELTQQIADVKNAIAARDFNAELNTALSDMVQSGNTVQAKEKYLQKLIAVLPRAKDPKAQSTIQSQMLDLAKAIQSDKITARSTQTSAKLVDYYNGRVSGGEIQDFLSQMAQTALSSQEAAAYATAAAQVATRERTLQTARVRAAASGGGASVTAVTRAVSDALKPLTKSTTDATKTFSDTTKRSGVPDSTAFDVMKQAAQTELDAIEQALPHSSGAATDALVKRRDAILNDVFTAQKAAATKTVQTQRDQQASFKDAVDTLKRQGAPYEETAALTARRVQAVKDARRSPWMHGFENDPTLGSDLSGMEADARKMLTDEAAVSTGLLTGQTATTKKLQTEYDRYREYFVKKGIAVPVGLDEWLRIMVNEKDANAVNSMIGLPKDAGSAADTRVEQDNIRTLWQDRHQEVQTAAENLAAAAWPRDAGGARVPYNTPLPGEGNIDPATGRPAFFDPTRGGLFDQSTFGPLIAAHQRGGPQDVFGGPGTGAGVVDPNAPSSGAGDMTPPPTDEMAASNAAARRAALAAMDPHDAADAVLAEPTTFTYPTWEIPSLPDWGAFAASGSMSGFDAGFQGDYTPPPLPTFSPPTLALPSGGNGNMPQLDPGFSDPNAGAGLSFAPPPPPGGGGSGSVLVA